MKFKPGQLVIVKSGAFYLHTIGQNMDEFVGLASWLKRATCRVEHDTTGLALSELRYHAERGPYVLVLVEEKILEVDWQLAEVYRKEHEV